MHFLGSERFVALAAALPSASHTEAQKTGRSILPCLAASVGLMGRSPGLSFLPLRTSARSVKLVTLNAGMSAAIPCDRRGKIGGDDEGGAEREETTAKPQDGHALFDGEPQ